MKSSPLMVGPAERELLRKLREYAFAHPMGNAAEIAQQCKTPAGLTAHKVRLESYTVDIPSAFVVTFTIEEQPLGLCRHLCMSSRIPGRVPNPIGAWIIAELLGFWGGDIKAVDGIFTEELPLQRKAINLAQRVEKPTAQ